MTDHYSQISVSPMTGKHRIRKTTYLEQFYNMFRSTAVRMKHNWLPTKYFCYFQDNK